MSAATGSRIVRVIEAAWSTIRANHPEVPEVVAVTGSGLKPGAVTWGHFWADRWVDGERRRPELFVSGQLLAEPARRIMQTLIHEAAHGLNHTRGRQDCNVNGRHNKRDFVSAAVELGLVWPDGKEPCATRGYSAVEITDETVERYADTIAAIEAARVAYLDDLKSLGISTTGTGGDGGKVERPGTGRGGRGGTRGGKRVNVTCECEDADPFPISPGRLERKPIMCPDCRELYRPVEADAA